MSRIEEIDKIVDEITNTDSLYEFAECVYEDRQRIAELEEQLKNAIVPKFKVGQDVWFIWGKSVMSFVVTRIDIEIKNCVLIGYGNKYWYQFEENCFATKEEAQAKLEELNGESK